MKLLVIILSLSILANNKSRALRIYNRIVGVYPTKEVLQEMVKKLDSNQLDDAINIALESDHFYDTTLKVMFNVWTNQEERPQVSLNDYSATAIGMVRDNIPFNEILYENILYVIDQENLP